MPDWPDWTAGNVSVIQLVGIVQAAEVGFTTADVTVTLNNETVAVTSAPLTLQTEFGLVLVVGWVQISPTGTGSTQGIARIRRGTDITGKVIGPQTPDVSWGTLTNVSMFLSVVDPLTKNTPQSYSLTVQANGATTNPVIVQAGLLVVAI